MMAQEMGQWRYWKLKDWIDWIYWSDWSEQRDYWLQQPSTYLSPILLLIVGLVIAQLDWPARGLDFLLVIFTCTVLLCEKKEFDLTPLTCED